MPVADIAVPLLPDQKTKGAEVLAHAFMTDPIFTYVFPKAAERLRVLRNHWAGAITYCRLHGEVWAASDVSGVVACLAPGRTDHTVWRHLRTGFTLPRVFLSFSLQSMGRYVGIYNYLKAMHDRAVKEPHWYVVALGVDPARQGRGIGTQLLRPVLARADDDGASCYLEAETERNVTFYQRHGFVVLGEGEAPGHPVHLWGMLRAPISRRSGAN